MVARHWAVAAPSAQGEIRYCFRSTPESSTTRGKCSFRSCVVPTIMSIASLNVVCRSVYGVVEYAGLPGPAVWVLDERTAAIMAATFQRSTCCKCRNTVGKTVSDVSCALAYFGLRAYLWLTSAYFGLLRRWPSAGCALDCRRGHPTCANMVLTSPLAPTKLSFSAPSCSKCSPTCAVQQGWAQR